MARCIVVHGGAGPLSMNTHAQASRDGCLAAARAGMVVLARGGRALDAVEAAVRVLEDDPTFNAGTGATLNAEGQVELDASLMDGATLAAGAVAAVRCFAHPISVARAVMERSPHVLLVGPGAESFGRAQGLPTVEPSSLITPRARATWEEKRAVPHGTVGAVAVDDAGHLAAATSTGGTTHKLPGRVGDSPLIGCGTFADDTLAAVSCTGHGEAIIRVTLARHAADLVDRGLTPGEAARQAVAQLRRARGEGGLILVSPAGEPAWAFDTERMPWATLDAQGRERVGFEPQFT